MATQSKEAPGDLAVVRAFVNTRDIDHGLEELSTPEEVVAWLADHDLLDKDAVARPGDVRRAALFREALRDLLLTNNDGRSVPTRSGAHPRRRRRPRPPAPARGSGRLRASRSRGQAVDAALGRLLVMVYRAMENDSWPRLKACRDDTCQWAFYDHSKNRSGHWCSMEVCGGRHKARQYRERRKSG